MCGYDCSSGGSYSGSGSCSYSKLENVVYSSSASYNPISNSYSSSSDSYGSGDIAYMISEAVPFNNTGMIAYESPATEKKNYPSNDYKAKPVSRSYFPAVDNFLALDRPRTVFVGSANEIKEFVEEAFTAVTGRELPNDILIRVLSKEEFVKANSMFSGKWNDGIQGFAVNRKSQGLVSEVFVRKGELDKIMLTLGHEIGHVLTRTLESKRDEEAKAFAFSIAWMKKIKEFNIANLSTAICLDKPAQNGLHDIALDFVLKKLKEGKDAYDIYKDLVTGLERVE
jgi:hypothetical protein